MTIKPHDGPEEVGAPGAENARAPRETQFAPADVAAILVERGWLGSASDAESNPALQNWIERAAELLGPHAANRSTLERLLGLIFCYDAAAILGQPEHQSVLVRGGARAVIRALANHLLLSDSPASGEANPRDASADLDSERFKQLVDSARDATGCRSRALFQPLRLALAGALGEGELDRVILLLDRAARLPFAVPVKGARQRILEFCAALD